MGAHSKTLKTMGKSVKCFAFTMSCLFCLLENRHTASTHLEAEQSRHSLQTKLLGK